MDEENMLFEFVVRYNSTECLVEQINDSYYGILHREFYKEGLERCHASYGDIIGWNNAFWGCLSAKNAKNAIDVFFEKWKEQEKERQNVK